VSTYWYFECDSHATPLRSEGEFTQHTDDAAYKHGIELANARPVGPVARHMGAGRYENNARDFLALHPTCHIYAISEHGIVVPVPAPMAPLDTWAWTNDEHTEARLGKWRAQQARLGWRVFHDDFHGPDWPIPMALHCETQEASDLLRYPVDHPATRRALADFLAWKSAQELPAEPTGLGAVVDTPYHHRLVRVPTWPAAAGPWFSEDAHRRFTWEQITNRGPVTVLSEGVTA